MYVGDVVFRWTTGSVAAVALLTASAVPARAQHEQHRPPAPPAGAAQDHSQHGENAVPMFPVREASGTAWLPDETPMYGIERKAGEWRVMGHGNVFVQYLNESGDRGSDQAGSINWVMGMARRALAGGRLGLRGMFSLEPWTIPGCGYPDLLATGEVCDGEAIHDRQHPHDLFMELAAEYERPLGGSVTVAAVRRAGWRAGARAGRLSASCLCHAEPARADRSSLAGRDPHHVRRRDRRRVPAAMEGRGVGLQRPRAGRAPRRASIWRRSTPTPAACRTSPTHASCSRCLRDT